MSRRSCERGLCARKGRSTRARPRTRPGRRHRRSCPGGRRSPGLWRDATGGSARSGSRASDSRRRRGTCPPRRTPRWGPSRSSRLRPRVRRRRRGAPPRPAHRRLRGSCRSGVGSPSPRWMRWIPSCRPSSGCRPDASAASPVSARTSSPGWRRRCRARWDGAPRLNRW